MSYAKLPNQNLEVNLLFTIPPQGLPMRNFHLPTLTLVIASMAGVTITGLQGADEAPSVEQRLQALDREVKLLKEAAEKQSAGTTGAATKDAPVKLTASAKDGFSVSSADGAYRLRVGGLAQLEGKFFIQDEELPFANTFSFSKVRPSFEGTVAHHFDYRVILDLVTTPAMVEALVTANFDPRIKATAGRFKVPFGLETLQSDAATCMITRGLPSALCPSRDVGLQVGGDLWGGALSYAVGIFNGPVDGASNSTDTNDGKDAFARVYTTPFKSSDQVFLQGLSLGIAGSYGYENDVTNALGTSVTTTNLPSYRTVGGNTFFSYAAPTGTPIATTARADGERLRFTPQIYWSIASFDMLAEYVATTQHIAMSTTADDDITNTAWQVAVGYVITGEKASFKGVTPGTSVGGDGWGAWQLVARYGVLEIDDKAFDNGYASRTASASSATNVGVGVNWYLNRNIKLMLNYDQVIFEDGAAGNDDRETEQVIQSRIQFSF